MKEPQMDLLITLDSRYIDPARVMLASLRRANPGTAFSVYVLHSALSEADIGRLRTVLRPSGGAIYPIQADRDPLLSGAPVTDRYPLEMYYRIFASRYLPAHLDRVLYLDPDIVVNGSLRPLYEIDLNGCYYAAASHVKEPMRKLNALRLGMEHAGPYINSGVLLINLKLLRKEQDYAAVFQYIEKHRNTLLLPDQDVISGLYSSRILPLNPYRYNMTERLFFLRPEAEAWLNLEWVRKHSAIIHYCGRNKPWKGNYIGKLDIFYKEAKAALTER